MSEHTMLSRSGNTGEGKKTSRLDIPVSEELEAEVISLATIAGLPKAEWLRLQIERIVHGELGMLRRVHQLHFKSHGKNVGSSSDESGQS